MVLAWFSVLLVCWLSGKKKKSFHRLGIQKMMVRRTAGCRHHPAHMTPVLSCAGDPPVSALGALRANFKSISGMLMLPSIPYTVDNSISASIHKIRTEISFFLSFILSFLHSFLLSLLPSFIIFVSFLQVAVTLEGLWHMQ